MRNGQNNNNKRMRNRNNNSSSNSNNNNNNRRGQNPMTRVFESNGPDIKIRGTASHVAEKYVQLARDARSSGDPVAAENYYQHAEHYFRLIATAQEQFRQNQPQPRTDNEMSDDSSGDDESESFSNFGAEPGFVPVQPPAFVPREQPREPNAYQPREQRPPRDHQQREHQLRDSQPRDSQRDPQRDSQRDLQRDLHRDQQQREHLPRDPQVADYQQRDPRPQPQPAFQPTAPALDPGVDRLPSFITGPQPQVNGGSFEGGGPEGGERFPPRRRRRPHGPRPDGLAAPVTPSDDFGSGNS